jgi:hypothetical protein
MTLKLKRRDHVEEISKSGEVMDGVETMKTKLKKKKGIMTID